MRRFIATVAAAALFAAITVATQAGTASAEVIWGT